MKNYKAYTVGEILVVLTLLLFLFGVVTFHVWYSIINHAPECIIARDVITCVKVKQLGGE